MNKQFLKKATAGLAMALSLMFLIAIISTPSAYAQDRGRHRGWENNRRDRNWDRNRDREWDRRREWERRRQLERQRAIERARQRDRYRYGSNRNFPYWGNSGYGNSGGYYSAEQQRGLRNGFKEGADDARDNDSFNPNRHSSFRDGNAAYRDGFYRGYQQGYRQYGYRGW